MAGGHTRALTAQHPIKPPSRRCLSAWQPNPGRRSTYRRGDSVQTTGATSNLFKKRLNCLERYALEQVHNLIYPLIDKAVIIFAELFEANAFGLDNLAEDVFPFFIFRLLR